MHFWGITAAGVVGCIFTECHTYIEVGWLITVQYVRSLMRKGHVLGNSTELNCGVEPRADSVLQ